MTVIPIIGHRCVHNKREIELFPSVITRPVNFGTQQPLTRFYKNYDTRYIENNKMKYNDTAELCVSRLQRHKVKRVFLTLGFMPKRFE